jgi:hypothetical protein
MLPGAVLIVMGLFMYGWLLKHIVIGWWLMEALPY